VAPISARDEPRLSSDTRGCEFSVFKSQKFVSHSKQQMSESRFTHGIVTRGNVFVIIEESGDEYNSSRALRKRKVALLRESVAMHRARVAQLPFAGGAITSFPSSHPYIRTLCLSGLASRSICFWIAGSDNWSRLLRATLRR